MATARLPYDISNFDFATNTFYGYRINAATGRLTVEVINDGTAVELPADDVLKDNQYRTWIWTKNTLQFSWSSTKKTHLKMEIL
jgi:hypothetical protein